MRRTRRRIADEWLVLACQDGDARAFEQLVSRWQKPLWRHARQVTGRDDLAWDALQEAWLAIVKGLRRLADPARFAAWAHMIVRNKSTDLVRRDVRRREALEEASRKPAPGPGAETDGLARALATLPARSREVLALHYRDGLSMVEIGALLEIPPGTVKSRLHHARKLLKEKLT